MRTTPLVAVLLALTACAGAGRPDAGDTFDRLNSAGIACAPQDVPLALTRGATDASCLTPEGVEIGITEFGSDDDQEAFLESATANTGGTVFRVLVYDYGYVMFVPDEQLGRRVARVMDARQLITSNRPCPQARGGVCPAGTSTLGGP